MRSRQSQVIVESTTLAARLSNRLLMALARESENSEDINLKKQINQSENRLKMVIAPFVESSKSMAINISDQVDMLCLQHEHVISITWVKIAIFDLGQGRYILPHWVRGTRHGGEQPHPPCLRW